MKIQAVIFRSSVYDTKMARKWLKKYKLRAIKRVDKTKNYLRYRIREPSEFKSFRTKRLDNIDLIFGNNSNL